jgi:hypothetical protein
MQQATLGCRVLVQRSRVACSTSICLLCIALSSKTFVAVALPLPSCPSNWMLSHMRSNSQSTGLWSLLTVWEIATALRERVKLQMAFNVLAAAHPDKSAEEVEADAQCGSNVTFVFRK